MSHEERAATMSREEIVALLAERDALVARNEQLARQVAWYRKQYFGEKSERRLVEVDPCQLTFGGLDLAPPESTSITVAEHSRRVQPKRPDSPSVDVLRFDPSVPVEEVRLPVPDLDGEHEVVSETITYRLAQRPATYTVIKFIRPVVKRKRDGILLRAALPEMVLGKSIADVSLLASMIIDKFVYHLPLYRQHQRMHAAGVHLARSTLTHLIHRSGDLLEPVVDAQLTSILASSTIAMDETPIKAGVQQPGKMRTSYFWPIYGDRAEIVFPFSTTRSRRVLDSLLVDYRGVLLTDGYAAYERFAAAIAGVVHAQCWSHTRRQFLAAEATTPGLAATALEYIRRLYEAEDVVRSMTVMHKKQEARAEKAKPIVNEFFEWLKDTLSRQLLLPREPFKEAAFYALERERGLRVFLEDPDVPLDTNHLEREIRPIAVGRKNWLFCWTEVGAKYVGIFHSLLATCRLHGLDPYVYLVDVLQRVDRHPASQVDLLTPRLWKANFAADPLRSVIDRLPVNNAVT